MGREVDADYIDEVIEMLADVPTAQSLDSLIVAHGKLGYFAAVVAGDAEMAKAEREYQEAESFRRHKESDPKATALQLEAWATIDSMPYRRAEVKALVASKKLSNLWDSVRQAIDAIKFLGKYEGPIGFGPQ